MSNGSDVGKGDGGKRSGGDGGGKAGQVPRTGQVPKGKPPAPKK